MATQKGILPIVGTLGGVNFYFRKGKQWLEKQDVVLMGRLLKLSQAWRALEKTTLSLEIVLRLRVLLELCCFLFQLL